ncbi:hypothetical protein BT96DRAFT_971013 [Gymnopus androsaceus JB14]|uniref:Uncharacterized protein n=1 Tax=Gymnopus androsaceus JB14 TaxID=1447944 RepID=A0A6A4I7G4_9AGAR|nr:hypothetical protein BT96DRAFT_971013 [Gymnopus androsaceus JB14]
MPYRLPDDVPLVLKTLTEIALYARSLENELRTHQMNSSADSGSEISGMGTGTPIHSQAKRQDDWDAYMADVDHLLRSLS